MLRYMLDTNICIFTIKNKPQVVREAFNRYHGQLAISTVTLMELIYGAEKSAAPERNLAIVEGFAARLDVLDYDIQGAAHTAQLRAELAKAGTPIGPYDRMIAGHARARGLTLVTNNLREFQRVPGLRVEDWVSHPR
ncbi:MULTISPECIES: type II toxin-antitoxin system tRNA(fMet)-specific endonuclease VapC [unclassified Pseudomonas]|uniref:type II toxin-antitoxin system tRNA(fMet)-specific endonuclease VapC n=1 Tax=unclassified Pseudomonas TaxID=196821 RepID=UPI001941ECCD|nr:MULTISPECIES: tRNA(fMet)-specific endonuclease VapC [unclassified Pseudomonas]MCE0916459.1 tRNA(fMet)-specific endonuclease VapC [Pseudomonas sp. NMI760_13]MCF1487265.1 tRNA(fMet)-specific endonuclease VapC [Pseudomonas sp. AA27]MCP8633896.1 tRNA(fMet)-specific endonuclease VapC [Pseudomonas sp. DVZ6]MDD7784756.1 tRNA(fMet)-specific endonuclease VapC [Pseudomonas sp. DVZ24]BCJ09087.1 ribonuclease VapC [Pseudomonas sp. RtIB026]